MGLFDKWKTAVFDVAEGKTVQFLSLDKNKFVSENEVRMKPTTDLALSPVHYLTKESHQVVPTKL